MTAIALQVPRPLKFEININYITPSAPSLPRPYFGIARMFSNFGFKLKSSIRVDDRSLHHLFARQPNVQGNILG